MTMLDHQASRALQAVAAARSPDEGAAARAWVVMQQRLVEGPPPALDLDPDDPAARPRSPWLAAALAIAAVAVVAVALAGWLAGWMAGVDARSDQQAPYLSEPPVPTPVAPPPGAVVAPAAVGVTEPAAVAEPTAVAEPAAITEPAAIAEPAAITEPTAPKTNHGRRADRRPHVEPRTPTEPSAAGNTLEAELRLLGQANTAMRAGHHARALEVLAQHAREFADGQLAPEREYKRALALCELGRVESARAVAEAFARAHPKSPLRTKASEVCREGAP